MSEDTLKHTVGSESDDWNRYIATQALASISPYAGDEETRGQMRAVVTAGLTGIAPRDEVEAMIAAQMLACHDAAMSCFRHALAANRSPVISRDYLNQAGKLSRAFAMLLDVLNHHRGKGQKITVEHVHVHSGGQAVVGVVEVPGGGVQPISESRSYETGIAAAPPPQPALRSEDKARDAVPMPSDAERALPDTRWEGRPSAG
jgi:hypothetical protein